MSTAAGAVYTEFFLKTTSERGGISAGIPEIQPEGAAKKKKQICLLHMFVRSANHPGVCQRNVPHPGMHNFRQFVASEELGQPSAIVFVEPEWMDLAAVYFAFLPGRKCCIHCVFKDRSSS